MEVSFPQQFPKPEKMSSHQNSKHQQEDILPKTEHIIPTTEDILLKTKYMIPAISSNTINRNNIYKLLDRSVSKKLVLISAAPGFGKTTALSQWANKTKKNVTWFSLDENDNNLKSFLTGLALSIKTINKEFGSEILSLLKNDNNLNFKYILTFIINKVIDLSFDFILIIDDYHEISDESVQSSILFLLENLPGNLHIFISTRNPDTKNLPVSKLRLNNNYTEIDTEALSFSKEEVNSFFKHSGINLSDNEITLIKKKTEGWALSLQLLNIYFQECGSINDFINNFRDETEYLFDYLMENVFSKFEDDLKIQLSKISALKKFNSELLDLVTENRGQEIIKLMKENNFFIIPMDKERNWYRFHNLFSEFLLRILEKDNPNLIPELHEKISKWFQKNGFLHESFEHIIKTKNNQLLMNFFESIDFFQLTELSDTNRLLDIFYKFDHKTMLSSPKLYYHHACLLRKVLKISEAEQLLNRFDHLNIINNLEQDDFHFVEKILNIKANIFIRKNDFEKALNCLGESLKIGLEINSPILLVTYRNLSILSIYKGELGNALEYILKSFEHSDINKEPLDTIININVKANIIREMGMFKEAEKVALKAIELIKTYKISRQQLYISIISELSVIKYYWNDITSFYSYFSEVLNLIEIINEPYLEFYNLLIFLQILINLEDFENSQKIIDKLDKWFLNNQLPITSKLHLNYLKVTLYILQNKLELAKYLLLQENQEESEILKSNLRLRYIRCTALIYLYRKTNRTSDALDLIPELLEKFKKSNRIAGVIKLLILKSILLQDLKRQDEAITELRLALQISEGQEIIRPFINFREEIYPLINSILHKTKSGETGLSINYIEKIINSFEHSMKGKQIKTKNFSEREIQILKLIEKGLSYNEISNCLGISMNTIKTHLKNTYSKLNAKNRIEAISKAKTVAII